MFPTEIDGFQVGSFSLPARALPAGHSCMFICAEQLEVFAAKSGGSLETMTVGIALPHTGRKTIYDWAIYAIRAPGADRAKLVPAWRAMVDRSGASAGAHEGIVGGHPFTVAMHVELGSNPPGWHFITTRGDVVLAIIDAGPSTWDPEPKVVQEYILEAIEKLD